LRSLEDFKKGHVVSDDVALNNPPPKRELPVSGY
jgi:hypothetical protein